MRDLREDFQAKGAFIPTQEIALRGKAVRLRDLQQSLLPQGASPPPQRLPHGSEALRMRRLSEELQPEGQPPQTQKNPRDQRTSRLRNLRQIVRRETLLCDAQGAARELPKHRKLDGDRDKAPDQHEQYHKPFALQVRSVYQKFFNETIPQLASAPTQEQNQAGAGGTGGTAGAANVFRYNNTTADHSHELSNERGKFESNDTQHSVNDH